MGEKGSLSFVQTLDSSLPDYYVRLNRCLSETVPTTYIDIIDCHGTPAFSCVSYDDVQPWYSGELVCGEVDFTGAIIYPIWENCLSNDCGCNDDFSPVCGSNGITYDNECLATCAGVSSSFGPCDTSCEFQFSGTVLYEECQGQTFITILQADGSLIDPYPLPGVNFDFYNGQSVSYSYRALDADIVCESAAIPVELICIDDINSNCDCPENFNPVCGADGQVYGNACLADCAGISYSDGMCPGSCELSNTGTILFEPCVGQDYILILDDEGHIWDPYLMGGLNFNFYNGQVVNFSYQSSPVVSPCYAGSAIEIVCIEESCLTNDNLACDDDPDNDGVIDSLDNCPASYNPDQQDTDNDGIGDLCDACPNDVDTNLNGVCDSDEADICQLDIVSVEIESCDEDYALVTFTLNWSSLSDEGSMIILGSGLPGSIPIPFQEILPPYNFQQSILKEQISGGILFHALLIGPDECQDNYYLYEPAPCESSSNCDCQGAYEPGCGEDGLFYTSPCEAACQGVNYADEDCNDGDCSLSISEICSPGLDATGAHLVDFVVSWNQDALLLDNQYLAFTVDSIVYDAFNVLFNDPPTAMSISVEPEVFAAGFVLGAYLEIAGCETYQEQAVPTTCATDDCDFESAIQDLAWLSEMIDLPDCCSQNKIYQLGLENNIYFLIDGSLDGTCIQDHPSRLYDCAGNLLCNNSGSESCYSLYDLANANMSLIYDCSLDAGNCDCAGMGEELVCGDDGVLYYNSCEATCMGVGFTPGPCEQQMSTLDEIIAQADCCEASRIFVFTDGSNEYHYVDSGSGTDCEDYQSPRLYDADGSLLCESSYLNNCYQLYGLANMLGTVDYNCEAANICDCDELPLCNFENPLSDLDWLAEISQAGDCCSSERIYQYSEGDRHLFYVDPAFQQPSCELGHVPQVYDCQGNLLCSSGPGVNCYGELELGSMDGSLIWDCYGHGPSISEYTHPLLSWQPVEAYEGHIDFEPAIREATMLSGIAPVQPDIMKMRSPNPTSGEVNLLLENDLGPWTLRIYDATGKMVLQENGQVLSIQANLGFCPSGIYFASVQAAGGIWTERVMLAKQIVESQR